jgi:[acyl-carrier-protein] S-malonyltransferase
MKGCSFLFPGQGAQYVGMGRGLVESFPESEDLLKRAELQLDLPLGEIMFSGPEERLHQDLNAQLAVYIVSCMVADLLANKSIRPAALAPYSSGIYGAAYGAGAVDFQTGLNLIVEADRCIREANSHGGMGVVLGLSLAEVEEMCERVEGQVEVSIVNTRHQIIVSGEHTAVDWLLKLAADSEALKTDRLPAAAPYHCSLLASADHCLARKISRIPMNEPHTPILSYIDQKPLVKAAQVAELLSIQLRSQVQWLGLVEELVRQNLAPMVEIGPGQMLGRSVRWICRQAEVLHTDTPGSLEKVIESLQHSN